MPSPIRRLALAAALAVAAPPSASGQGGVLAGCADPSLPPRDSLTLCQRALRDPHLSPDQRAAVLVNLGVAQAAVGSHADAERSFGLAIATDPGMTLAYANRARSRLALGRFEEAIADFDEAARRSPGDAEIWLGRGGALLRAGAARAAITDLTRAIEIDPELDAAYFNRGVARLMTGETEAAEDDFSTVIARAPEDAGAFLNRGRARAEHAPERARGDFDRAIALDPEWAGAFFARGLFLDRRGARDAAEADFRRAYELGHRDPWLLERLGLLGDR